MREDACLNHWSARQQCSSGAYSLNEAINVPKPRQGGSALQVLHNLSRSGAKLPLAGKWPLASHRSKAFFFRRKTDLSCPGPGAVPDLISFGSALSACARASAWEEALGLLSALPQQARMARGEARQSVGASTTTAATATSNWHLHQQACAADS